MNSFKSWDEVKDWLLQDEQVYTGSWTIGQAYMCCWSTAEGESCCEDNYTSVEEALGDVKRLSDGKLEEVFKV